MKHFTEEIVQALANRLPDTEIEVREISKPGEKRLTGLCIRSPHTAIAPILYLNESFELYRQGTPVAVIADKLLEIYQQHTINMPFDTSTITDWGEASQRVCARLINVPHNTAYLADKIFEPLPGTDIAIMYYLDLNSVHDGATAPVTNHLFASWGITPGVLHDIALINTARLHTPKVEPMYAMMAEMIGEDPLLDQPAPMYVVTSNDMTFGAVLALIPDVVEELEEHLGDFFLLPSSIFDMIAVPQSLQTPDMLLQMVTDINHTQVEEKDRLSDDVYVIRHGNLVSAFADDPDTRNQIQRQSLAWLPFPAVGI